MARMYSGKRGSSGSTRPVSRRPPAWFKYQTEEVEDLILKLSKEGNPPSIIGQILRDRYGIPLVSQVAGKRLERYIPQENKPKIPEDLELLVRRPTNVTRHLDRNRKHYPTKRDLPPLHSKLHRLPTSHRHTDLTTTQWHP